MFRRLCGLMALVLLGGCAAEPSAPAEILVMPGGYAEAFEAAKGAVLEGGFELDRVDARGGVISSRPKGTGGLATPWDTEQTTLEQELEDLANQQMRVVRITFWPEGEDVQMSPEGDLRDEDRALRARVEVSVQRVHRPGWRIETTSVQQSRRWRDPDMGRRGLSGRYVVPFALDMHLAHRLAREIDRRSEGAQVVRIDTERPRVVEPPRRAAPAQRPGPSGYWD
jgi:hypothetical protein